MTIFHVSIGFVGPTVDFTKIQQAFPNGAGWARYAPNCWLVDAEVGPEIIARAVKELLAPADSVFVVELKLQNNFGFLQKELWDWVNSRSTLL